MIFSPVRKSKHVGIKTECACGVVHDSRKEDGAVVSICATCRTKARSWDLGHTLAMTST